MEAKRLRPNHVCEVAFEHPILIKDDPYIIFVFLMAEDGDSGGAVAGLVCIWEPDPSWHSDGANLTP